MSDNLRPPMRFDVVFALFAIGVLPLVGSAGCSGLDCGDTRNCPFSSSKAGGSGGSEVDDAGAGGDAGSNPTGGGMSGDGGRAGTSGGKGEPSSGGTSSGGIDDSGGAESKSGEGGQIAGTGGDNGGEGGAAEPAGAGGSAGEDNGPAVCGNGRIEEGEACDDGEENGLYLEACAPDCSRIIARKYVVIGDSVPTSDLRPNPVVTADSLCPAGYKAMFPFGTVRRATTRPFETVNSIDWVIQPYTYYVNNNENLVWLTNEVALLGVEGGRFVGLVNEIESAFECYVSNMNIDGTTLETNNCAGWATENSGYAKQCGAPLFTTEQYLAYGQWECGEHATYFYCVEQ